MRKTLSVTREIWEHVGENFLDRAEYLRALARSVVPYELKGPEYLDIGGGTGTNTFVFAEGWEKAYCLDIRLPPEEKPFSANHLRPGRRTAPVVPGRILRPCHHVLVGRARRRPSAGGL